MSDEIKLLSCPFCDERTAESWHEQRKHFIYCQSCGARGPFSMKHNPEEAANDAITAWNTRAETSKEAMLQASNRALDDTLTMRNEELDRLRAENAELLRKMKLRGAALLYAGPILSRCGVSADTMEGFYLKCLWQQSGVEWKFFLDSKDIQDTMSYIAKGQI